jgi:predicted metal-dependent peptidase
VKLKLSDFFTQLILLKSFYGRLAASLQRVCKPGMGTMAVGVRDGRITFYYDPEFIDKIPYQSALFALEHEMLHVVLDHIPRYLEMLALCTSELERKKAAAIYNIAMDAAINHLNRAHPGCAEIQEFMEAEIAALYPDLPPDPRNGIVLPEKFNLPLDGHFELYLTLLMQQVEVKEIAMRLVGATTHEMWGDGTGKGEKDKDGKGQGEGAGDGKGKDGDGKPGEGGGQGSNDNRDLIFGGSTLSDMSAEELNAMAREVRENAKKILRSTVNEMGGIGRGLLPGGVEAWLEEYLREPIVPWWEIFMTRARMSRLAKFNRSITVPNRALLALSEVDTRIVASPGRVRDRAWRIFFYVDTSGSMSTDSLAIAKSELQHMLDVDDNMEIRFMQGDAATHFDEVLKTGDALPGPMIGRGGTDFDAYFIHMKQYVGDDATRPDLVIVYTDGYAPPVSHANKLPNDIPVIWLVTPHYSQHFQQGYGEIIVCDNGHNEYYKAA